MPGAYEVEFSDDDGRTYATVSLKADQIMRLHHERIHETPACFVMLVEASLSYAATAGGPTFRVQFENQHRSGLIRANVGEAEVHSQVERGPDV